jgi:hypothetical protein
MMRRGQRFLAAGVIAAIGAAGLAVATAGPAVAAPFGPTTQGSTTLTVSETAGLANGQGISITASQSGGNTQTNITARICDPTIPPTQAGAAFNFGPSGPYCPQGGSQTSPPGGVSTIGAGTTERSSTFGATTGPTTLSGFAAGQGTVQWNDQSQAAPPPYLHTLTCNSSNGCELVVQVQRTGGSDFFFIPLTYFGTPSAATGVTSTPGNGLLHISWTNPSGAGLANGTLQPSVVNVSGAAPCVSVCHFPAASAGATSVDATGLTNFTAYTVTVTTNTLASDGVTPGSTTSSSIGPNASTTPGPAAAAAPSGTPANGAVNLTWSQPSFTTGLTGYQVKAYTGGGTTLFSTTPFGLVLSGQITGLANGTPYVFTVTAQYGANAGQESPFSAPITPAGKRITQTFDVTRPVGDLVMTQACAPGSITMDNAYAYPVDANGIPNPTYPTDCTVHLGTAHLLTADHTAFDYLATPITSGPTYAHGNYFRATGDIQQVTITDTRDTDNGWNLNVQITDFTHNSNHFSGNNLGMIPTVTDHSPPFSSPDGNYTMTVHSGNPVYPGATGAGGMGSGTPTVALGEAQNCTVPTYPTTCTGGLGMALMDAHLALMIPVFDKADTYTAVMTFTAI